MAESTARLRLVVDSTGLDKGGRSIRDLRAEARRAEAQARQLQDAFKGLAAILGTAFSFSSISKATELFNEQARSVAKVEQAIRSTAGAAGFASRQLQDAASALQGSTLFGDEEILNKVTAQLLTFTNIANTEFLRTQKVALDLATVLDGDLKSASIQLGKALNDPVANLSALSKAGIQFSADQKALINSLVETGRLAEAQGVILSELERQYGGQAEAAAAVGTGVLKQLQNLFGDIQEIIGGNIVEAIRPAATALRDFLSVAENQQQVVEVLGAVGAGLAVIVAPAVLSGLGTLAGLFLGLTAPIVAVGVGIGAIVAFRDEIAQTFTGFDNAGAVIRVLASDLKDFLAPVIANVVALAEAAAQAVGNLIRTGQERTQAGLISKDQDLSDKLRAIQDERRALAGQLSAAIAAGDEFEATILTATDQQLAGRFEKLRAERGKVIDEINRLNGMMEGENGATGYLADVGERARELVEPLEKLSAANDDLARTSAAAAAGLNKEAKAADDYARALQSVLDDQQSQQMLIEAAIIGERELQIATEVLAIRRQIAGISDDEARALAERNVELDEQLQLIRDQRQLFEGLFDQFGHDAGDMWRAFVADGRVAADSLQDVFARLLDGFGKGLGDVFRLLTKGGGLNIRNGIGGIFENIAKNFGGLKTSIEGLAKAVGFGARGAGILGALGSGAVGGLAGISIGSGLGRSVNPYARQDNQLIGGGLGAVAGGIGASAALSAFLASGTGAAAGILGGAIAGSVVPVIGTIIGGLLGAFGGSLFGKTSDEFARGVFDLNTGATLFESNKKNNQENIGARNELAKAATDISTVIAQLTGATFGASRAGISVGSRDGIQVLRDASIAGDAAFLSSNVAYRGKDPEAALRAILGQAIDSLQGGQEALVNYAQAAFDAGDDLESIVVRLEELSEFSKRLEASTDPLLAGIKGLSVAFDSVVKDANDLGVAIGPGSDVARLIQNDLAAFFDQAVSSGTSVAELNARLSEFSSVLADVGISADITAAALEDVVRAQRQAFETDIADQLGQYINGPLEQLEALLKGQAERLEEAKALGADLDAVNRLTALEQRDFFTSLSDDALREVEGFLGLFEEATNSVVRNLDLSRQDLSARASAFGQFAQEFANLNQQFTEQFVVASPRESIDSLRARAGDLLGQVRAGNDSAAQALPQVLQQLVDNARATFGNTKGFTDVLSFAQSTLAEAEKAALSVQSEAERQIAALDEQNDILGDIRDILQSGQATNAFLASYVGGGIASSADLLSLIQSGAGLSANDNAGTLSVTGLMGQSLQPVVVAMTDAIGQLSDRLQDMPSLQSQTILAVDRGAAEVANSVRDLDERMDRIETILKKSLEQQERIAS